MANRLAQDKFFELLERKFGDKLVYDNTVYAGKKKEVTVRCKIHGDFNILPWTLLRSNVGCRSCKESNAVSDFLRKSKLAHGDTYRYDKIEYVNTTTPVEVVCKHHGSFWIEPWEHYSKSVGCMGCFQDRNRLSQESFLAKARSKHGDKYDYSAVQYESHTKPVVIICPTHGRFEQEVRVHLTGSGCARCFDDRNRSNTEDFIQKAKEVHGDKFNYDKVVYRTSKTKVEIVCATHGSFWMTPNGHVSSRYGCPRCKESRGESRVRTVLERYRIEFEQEYRIKTYRYRYDFYIPTLKLLIEYHGHQHYKPVEVFGGEFEFNKVIQRDVEKERIARELGFQLIVIDHRRVGDEDLEDFLTKVLVYKGHDFG